MSLFITHNKCISFNILVRWTGDVCVISFLVKNYIYVIEKWNAVREKPRMAWEIYETKFCEECKPGCLQCSINSVHHDKHVYSRPSIFCRIIWKWYTNKESVVVFAWFTVKVEWPFLWEGGSRGAVCLPACVKKSHLETRDYSLIGHGLLKVLEQHWAAVDLTYDLYWS